VIVVGTAVDHYVVDIATNIRPQMAEMAIHKSLHMGGTVREAEGDYFEVFETAMCDYCH
jgi:hypothetical protein